MNLAKSTSEQYGTTNNFPRLVCCVGILGHCRAGIGTKGSIVAIVQGILAAALVRSLARPGGNVAGASIFGAELGNRQKQVKARLRLLGAQAAAKFFAVGQGSGRLHLSP